MSYYKSLLCGAVGGTLAVILGVISLEYIRMTDQWRSEAKIRRTLEQRRQRIQEVGREAVEKEMEARKRRNPKGADQ